MQENNQELEKLIEKYLKGTCNEEESKTVEIFFDSFSSRPDILAQKPPEECLAIKTRIHKAVLSKITKRKARKIRYLKRSAIIAAALVCISLSFLYLFSAVFNSTNEISLANGQQREIVLEDGTKITLNASSKIIYPKTFKNAERREVTLIGEAFFDVAKNPKQPFLIHTPRMEIKVLGTAFNVRDYDDEKNAETALVRGKVSIWKTGTEKQIFTLKPKEKFVVSQELPNKLEKGKPQTLATAKDPTIAIQPFIISEKDGTSLETEWLLKRITINEEPLFEIVKKLERMYGVHIEILNTAVAKQHYSATFDNEDLDNILKALQTVTSFQYKRLDNKNIQIL